LPHPFHNDSRCDKVSAMIRKEHAARCRPDVVPGATHSLQTAGYRRWRLYLHNDIHGTHIDPKL
jgi:hypothetical protein